MSDSESKITKPTGLLFISGGSALNKLAQSFAASELHATHLIAVFDNGGSTALLRRYCGIAVGDIRNRLIAIADHGNSVSAQMAKVFGIRLHGNKPRQLMRRTVEEMIEGNSDYISQLPKELIDQIAEALGTLLRILPGDFDWRDGSIGNFILVGKYLQCKDWGATLEWAHQILSACGQVLPITTENAHLGARLENGMSVVGQSRLTDESKPIRSPIQRLLLHPTDKSSAKAVTVRIYPAALEALQQARAIVYSWGSFYTSVLSAFLVSGVAEAVLNSRAAKVVMINPLGDAETLGKTPVDLVKELISYCSRGNTAAIGPVVTHALALTSDNASSQYYNSTYRAAIEQLGIELIEIECNGSPRAEHLEIIKDQLIRLSNWSAPR